MKVILVNGSPKQYGSTYNALCEVEKELKKDSIETEIFWIGDNPISGCRGCGACKTLGKCVYDDTVNEFVGKASSADGFVFGSPVHYAAMSGHLKSFMDRAFYCGGKDTYYLKPASAVVVARRGGCASAFDEMNKYFSISEMPIITSSYWNMVYAAKPEDVCQDKEGLSTMRNLAKNMSYFLKCKKIAAENGCGVPERIIPERTNFTK